LDSAWDAVDHLSSSPTDALLGIRRMIISIMESTGTPGSRSAYIRGRDHAPHAGAWMRGSTGAWLATGSALMFHLEVDEGREAVRKRLLERLIARLSHRVPMPLQRQGGRKLIMTPEGAVPAPKPRR
jgi:hypothetical protein